MLPTPQTLYRVCELHLDELRTDFQRRHLTATCGHIDASLVRIVAETLTRIGARATIAPAYWRRLRSRISGSSLVLWK